MLEQVGLSEGAQVDVLVEGDHLVQGVILADQTKSIDFNARSVRFLAKAPFGLLATVLDRAAEILQAD